MSSSSKWREDQVLILCPGSQTTLAQLGCNDLTPPQHRFPTRMFWDKQSRKYNAVKTYRRKKQPAAGPDAPEKKGDEDDEFEWVEDPDSLEGAVCPIRSGYIYNMPAFLALLEHVHGTLVGKHLNAPVILMTSPQWSRRCREQVTRFLFESLHIPSLCMIHSAMAAQAGVKAPRVTVIDIGYEKVDVSCVFDGLVVAEKTIDGMPYQRQPDRPEIAGGQRFTENLLEALRDKGFTLEMAEQLKKSPVCEVLPYDRAPPLYMTPPSESAPPDAPAEPSKAAAAAAAAAAVAAAAPSAPDEDPGAAAAADGVLDVANIVASGQTQQFLAKNRGKGGRKGRGKEHDSASKGHKLANSKKVTNTFYYEEIVEETAEDEPPAAGLGQEDGAPPKPKQGDSGANPEAADGSKNEEKASGADDETNGGVDIKTNGGIDIKTNGGTDIKTNGGVDIKMNGGANDETNGTASGETNGAASDETNGAANDETNGGPAPPAAAASQDAPAAEKGMKKIRREIEVGLERFTFARRDDIDLIADHVYRAIQGVVPMGKRPALWNNILFVGNGARLRGLRDNVLQTLHARYLVTARYPDYYDSDFAFDLPSDLATPAGTGTGTQTPTGSFAAPTGGGNTLLQAATKASALASTNAQYALSPLHLASADPFAPVDENFDQQTPRSIRQVQLPTYMGEWTKNGFEEVAFLGCQIVGRLVFCQLGPEPDSKRFMCMTRTRYNARGPKAIHHCTLMG